MLILNELTFRYQQHEPAYRFTLTLSRGQIATIHGLSGSGKSTLLDLTAGFLQPDSGSVSWCGEDLTGLPPQHRPVTYVFQRHNLFEHRSALDNVLIGINPKSSHTPQEIEMASSALSQVGLAQQIHQRASTLSGGQQQRVAIARAMLREKGILLLDEPFSALDPDTRSDMLQLIKQIARSQQAAVLMVTHDQRDADEIADVRFALVNREVVTQSSG